VAMAAQASAELRNEPAAFARRASAPKASH
jgi:hypothetical protein